MNDPITQMIEQIKHDTNNGVMKKKLMFPLTNFLSKLKEIKPAINRIVLDLEENEIKINLTGINKRKIQFILDEYTIKTEKQRSVILLTKKSEIEDLLESTYMMLSI